MDFGVQFFPAVGPDRKSAAQYWGEALALTVLAEKAGYSHVRTVEHYFHPYGGYSPNPLVFLAAAATRTSRIRLVTGAVLPVFNHPLKLAGEIGMVDALSEGRLDIGFARAFLPHEFAHFGVSLDESRARFDEGVEQVRLLLEQPVASSAGRFHAFDSVTSLPRPTQSPRPPFWIAALATPESFEAAGRNGYNLMAIPLGGSQMGKLLGLYRQAWKQAGHAGSGRAMLAFHMLCAETDELAAELARDEINAYLQSIIDAASGWLTGVSSKDYPNYDKMLQALRSETFETQLEKGAAWVGSPATLRKQITEYVRAVGGFESASLQVNFGGLDISVATKSMQLFAEEVIPHFS